jgi:hypothetical protein
MERRAARSRLDPRLDRSPMHRLRVAEAEGGPDAGPSEVSTLVAVDRFLQQSSHWRESPDERILCELTSRQLSDYITAALARLAKDSYYWMDRFDDDWGPELMESFQGLSFHPNLERLFLIFLALSRRALNFWMTWLAEDPDRAKSWFPYWDGGSQFSVSLRVAWVASVAGPSDWLKFLESALHSREAKRRFVAARAVAILPLMARSREQTPPRSRHCPCGSSRRAQWKGRPLPIWPGVSVQGESGSSGNWLVPG